MYEVHDYIKSYLGETEEAHEFAKSFLERRLKIKTVSDTPASSQVSVCVCVYTTSEILVFVCLARLWTYIMCLGWRYVDFCKSNTLAIHFVHKDTSTEI